jgi:hypothetical protein
MLAFPAVLLIKDKRFSLTPASTKIPRQVNTVDSETPSNTGQSIMAVDIAAFADKRSFKLNVDEIWKVMKSSPNLLQNIASELA